MSKQRETLPVIFRNEGTRGRPEIVAVFPTLPGTDDPNTFTVYAHVGQHASARFDWYQKTHAATPEQFGELLGELSRIYQEGEDAVTLQPVQRFTKYHNKARRAALAS